MTVVRAESHAGYVDVAVVDGHQREILLASGLAAGGEFGDRASWRRLGHLAAGVGVDLRVEYEDVDVAAGSEHVIEAAITDVVGPAVAADDPDALLDQIVGHREKFAGARAVDMQEFFFELPDALPLLENSGFAR